MHIFYNLLFYFFPAYYTQVFSLSLRILTAKTKLAQPRKDNVNTTQVLNFMLSNIQYSISITVV